MDAWCARIRRIAEERIAGGEPIALCRETVALRAGSKEIKDNAETKAPHGA